VGSADTLGANTVRDEPDRPRGVTLRATLLGIGLVGVLAFLIPYASNPNGRPGFDLGAGVVPDAAVLALLVVMGPIGGLLLWIRPRSRLTGAEVLTIYAIVAGTAAIASEGYAAHLTTMLTASQYMAHPWNRWGVLIGPHIAPWMQFSDTQAIQWLWEGAPIGAPVPWIPWVVPLAGWCAIALLIYCGLFCLMSLLRRDWIERQRLTFPLAQVPLEVVGAGEGPGSQLLRRPGVWAGFGIAFCHGGLAFLSSRVPIIPALSMSYPVGRAFQPGAVPWGYLSELQFNLHWGTIGVMCLLPTDVSLSLWLFNVWHYGLMVFLSSVGYGDGGAPIYSADTRHLLIYQTMGALLGFGAFLLYQSRSTLRAAVMAWWDPVLRAEDDPLELVKPRYAIGGLAVSSLLLGVAAVVVGAQPVRIWLQVFAFYLAAVSLTRVVAASGSPYVDSIHSIRYFLSRVIGTEGVRPDTLVFANQLNTVFSNAQQTTYSYYIANDMKILHSARVRGTSVVVALLAATVLMVAVAPLGRIALGYQYGYGNLTGPQNIWLYRVVPGFEFGDLADELQLPRHLSSVGVAAALSGALLAPALALLQINVAWWRLSPVGFLLQGPWSASLNPLLWADALVGWAVVSLILRFGGRRGYQQSRPVFLGLFLGAACATLLNSLIGVAASALRAPT